MKYIRLNQFGEDISTLSSLRGLCPSFIDDSLIFVWGISLKTFLWFYWRLRLWLRSLCLKTAVYPKMGISHTFHYFNQSRQRLSTNPYPLKVCIPNEENSTVVPLENVGHSSSYLRNRDWSFLSTQLGRLMLLPLLPFNPKDNYLQTIVWSAGQIDSFWLSCAQNPRRVGTVCYSMVECVLSVYKVLGSIPAQTEHSSKILPKPQVFPENYLCSFQLSTFPTLSARFGKRSTKFLGWH